MIGIHEIERALIGTIGRPGSFLPCTVGNDTRWR